MSLILQSSWNSSTREKKMEGERRQQQLLPAGGDEEEISDVLLQDLEDGGRYETWEMQEDWEVEEEIVDELEEEESTSRPASTSAQSICPSRYYLILLPFFMSRLLLLLPSV